MEKATDQRLKFLKFNSDAPSHAIEQLAQILAIQERKKNANA